MNLKSLLKKVNKKNQRNLGLSYASEVTGLTKEECIKEKLAFVRNLSFLKKYSTTFEPLKYHSGLMTAEEGGDYSYLRIRFGREWYEYVDIYHRRGFLFDDGVRRTPQSWGINNMATDDDYAEFDTLEELRVYYRGNYEKYYLVLNSFRFIHFSDILFLLLCSLSVIIINLISGLF